MKTDAQSISGSLDNKDVALQPVPDSIKYGAIGLLALILIVVIWFLTSSDDDGATTAQTLVDIENIEQTLEPAQELESDLQPPAYDPLESTGSIKVSPILTDESNPTFDSQTTETDLQLTTLKEQLSQLNSENNIRQQGQDQLIQELQSQLTAQAAKIEQLQANAKARQRAVTTKKKSSKPYRKVKPPFTLVSVDLWGNDLYAVVRLKNQLYEFTHGQGMKGWRVHSFDRSRRAVVFKNKAGTRRELVVKS